MMRIKKHKGRVYGCDMTAAERRAADIEIRKQLAEYDRKHTIEIDALVLWILRTEFGFGKKRLRRFYERFGADIHALLDRYVMEQDEAIWLCTFKLEESGIPIKEWHEELKAQMGGEEE
jgi:hypothetical protein